MPTFIPVSVETVFLYPILPIPKEISCGSDLIESVIVIIQKLFHTPMLSYSPYQHNTAFSLHIPVFLITVHDSITVVVVRDWNLTMTLMNINYYSYTERSGRLTDFTTANPPLPIWRGGGLAVLAVVKFERSETDGPEVVMLVGPRELVVADGMGSKSLLGAKGTPPLVDEMLRSPMILCFNALANSSKMSTVHRQSCSLHQNLRPHMYLAVQA